MGRSQIQYVIVANRRCTTHRPGTTLVYTGPRSGVANGWTVLRRYMPREDTGGVV